MSFTRDFFSKFPNPFKKSGSAKFDKEPMPFKWIGWEESGKLGPFVCNYCSGYFFAPTEHHCTRQYFAMDYDNIPLYHPTFGPTANDPEYASRTSRFRSPSTPSKIDQPPKYKSFGESSFYTHDEKDPLFDDKK